MKSITERLNISKKSILEKLKVSAKNNIDPQELFASVLDLLWHYGELDVKPLKLMCSYLHDYSQKSLIY